MGFSELPSLNNFQKSILAIGMGHLVALPVVEAATITVDTIVDVDSNSPNPSPCTLREAVSSFENSNTLLTGCNFVGLLGINDAINFDPGLIPDVGPAIIRLSQAAALSITTDLTINGLGEDLLIIDGNNNSGVFDIGSNGETVTLDNLAITRGRAGRGGGINVAFANVNLTNCKVLSNFATSEGGGIFASFGSIIITDSTVSGNLSVDGGGISSGYAGDVSLSNSSVSGNSASQKGGGISAQGTFSKISLSNSKVSGNKSTDGGGIFVSGEFNSFPRFSSVSLSNSSVNSNTATSTGGGIYADNYSSITLNNSTVVDNQASTSGGGLVVFRNLSFASLTNSTVSGNSAASIDGTAGIAVDEGSLTLLNATVADNTAGFKAGLYVYGSGSVSMTNTIIANNVGNVGPDCRNNGGTINASGGGNLVEDELTCGVFSIEGQDPLLGSLKNNGGATETHALLEGSPAIDAGLSTLCPETDQRGRQRSDNACDIGAYEFIGGSFFVVPLPAGRSVIFEL